MPQTSLHRPVGSILLLFAVGAFAASELDDTSNLFSAPSVAPMEGSVSDVASEAPLLQAARPDVARPRNESRSRFGGLLVGTRVRFGYHPEKPSEELTYYRVERAFDLSIGYAPSNWGVSFVLPVGGTYEFPTAWGREENRGPSMEVLGIWPLREAGIAGSMAVGSMQFTKREWLGRKGWGPMTTDNGWFLRPTLGLFLPSAFSYLRPSLGYEVQSDWTGPSSKAHWEHALHLEIEVGLRLGN